MENYISHILIPLGFLEPSISLSSVDVHPLGEQLNHESASLPIKQSAAVSPPIRPAAAQEAH